MECRRSWQTSCCVGKKEGNWSENYKGMFSSDVIKERTSNKL